MCLILMYDTTTRPVLKSKSKLFPVSVDVDFCFLSSSLWPLTPQIHTNPAAGSVCMFGSQGSDVSFGRRPRSPFCSCCLFLSEEEFNCRHTELIWGQNTGSNIYYNKTLSLQHPAIFTAFQKNICTFQCRMSSLSKIHPTVLQ